MSLKPAVLTLLGLWVYYLSLDLFSWYYPAIQPINATAVVGVHIFNLTVVFMMFGYLALYYLNKVNLTHDQLRFYATTDPLTKLRNRRHMSELLKRALQNKHAEQRNVSVLLLDLDHLNQSMIHMGTKSAIRYFALLLIFYATPYAIMTKFLVGGVRSFWCFYHEPT